MLELKLLLRLLQAQHAIGEKERLAGTAASALSEAQAARGPLDEKIRNERSTFDHHKEVQGVTCCARYFKRHAI
jgi:hypothetical protein